MHFFFLASFFWVNVMSFDIWRTFRHMRGYSSMVKTTIGLVFEPIELRYLENLPAYEGIIEEGRAASKSSHKTFGDFLSISQQEVSADIIQNSKFSC
jgi:hypothetical protein